MFFTPASKAQIDIWDGLKALNLEFSGIDFEAFDNFYSQKEEFDSLFHLAIEKEDMPALEEAAERSFSATRDLFNLFEKYCRDITEIFPDKIPAFLQRAEELEITSSSKINRSAILRSYAENSSEFNKSRHLYLMALDLEQLALLHKGRALRIYQDFPVIYEYPWHDDIADLSGLPGEVLMIFEEDTALESADAGVINDSLVRDELLPDKGIVFIVQIAAHTSEISGQNLENIYDGPGEIKMMIEDNWYKYYLGPFSTFGEAEMVMKSLTKGNAFIAAYLDGKRIGIGDAINRQLRQN